MKLYSRHVSSPLLILIGKASNRTPIDVKDTHFAISREKHLATITIITEYMCDYGFKTPIFYLLDVYTRENVFNYFSYIYTKGHIFQPFVLPS